MNERLAFLETSAAAYGPDIIAGWERLYRRKRQALFKAFSAWFIGDAALELGCADGELTARLEARFKRVTVVDGSKLFLDQVKRRLGTASITYEYSLFEEWDTADSFDTVVMAHILEHLPDPHALLSRARGWLSPGGRILIAVPNARSLHRYVGVRMGLLPSVDALNDQDVKLGHLRVYTPESIRAEVEKAGLVVEKFGGLMVKPIANRQIEAQWSDQLIQAFFDISDDFPELCSEMFVIATRGGDRHG